MNLTTGVIDNSTFTLYQLCPRRCFYRNIMNLRPRGRMWGADFGSGLHEALNYWHTHLDEPEGDRIIHSLEAFNASYDEPVDDEDFRTLGHASTIMENYASRYPNDSSLFTLYHQPEEGFAVSIGPYTLVGRIDMMIRFNDSGVWLLDHKTTSVMGKGFWEEFRLSTQLDAYILAASTIINEPVLGVYINGIGTAKSHVKQPEKYLLRKQYQRPKWRLQEFITDFIQTMDEVTSLPTNDYRKWKQKKCNCVGKYGPCPFLDLCDYGEELWEGIIANAYVVDPWEPYELFVKGEKE